MTYREQQIERIVQGYDRDLCVRTCDRGITHIYRKTRRYETYDLGNKNFLTHAREDYWRVFSLTDTWTALGKPREWGLEVILNRLKALDLHRSTLYWDEVEKAHEQAEESAKRTQKNNIESFLLDYRRQFAKTFDGINTGIMDKTDRRKLKGV